MKTPREMLMGHHRAAQPKLDAVRREAIATVVNVVKEPASFSLREFLWSVRWHAAGMSVVWVFLLCLRMGASNGMPMVASVVPATTPSPQVILTALRENRRWISELIETHPTDAEQRKSLIPQPRSDRRATVFTA